MLAMPRYGRLGASSRLRFWQYVPWLEAAGFNVDARPLLPDSYIEDLQVGRRSTVPIAIAYLRQIAHLLMHRRYDLLWIEKEVLPWIPGVFENAILTRGIPRVFDYDDAVYHLYGAHRQPVVRALLGNKHPVGMRAATMVVAGNATLAERATLAGASRVAIVPTVIDLARYPLLESKSDDDALPRICWIGQHSTAGFLKPYAGLFGALTRAGRARFIAIGIDAPALGLPMESVAWSEAGEVAAIAACDIGIMPLADGPFERGKCGYKLIQYMACGLPVIASPVGVNREIVQHGVNGFLAETPEQWQNAISALIADPALRARMGAAGRRRVEQTYSLQVTGPLMAALLASVAGR
jgi:glycosyltransferase involved in cell wall biosynthesis